MEESVNKKFKDIQNLIDEEETTEFEQTVSIDSSNVQPHWLPEVKVTKKRDSRENDIAEKANVAYDVKAEVDKIRDEGELESNEIYAFLSDINPYFTYIIGDISDPTSINCWYKGRKVAFVVNNNPVGNKDAFYDRIDQILTIDIESIYIVEDRDVYFSYYLEEMIDIVRNMKSNYVTVFVYTNKDGSRRKEHKGIRPTKLTGYSVPSQFYQADYRTGTPANEQDFRRTLYWKPNLKTDNEGKVSINFYNNSTCKQIVISAEGLTNEGTPLLLKNNLTSGE